MDNQNGNLLVDNSQIPLFERGFKSWSDNVSVAIRNRLNLKKHEALSPYELAMYIGVKIIIPKDIPGLSKETMEFLTSSKGDEWSAVTIQNDTVKIIVTNPLHSERRRANTLMHELSHIIRRHTSSQVYINEMGITFRNFDKLQEAEADWLAGSLLLPRSVLIYCHFKKYSIEEACQIYGVSKSLFIYRMNKSAVKKQFKNRV